MTGLRLTNIQVRYGGIVAVRDVSLEVAAGTICSVLGPNGAGKTSLLRAISGVVRPAAGEVTWDGADITGLPSYKVARTGLSLVPEGRRVFSRLSVWENLVVGAYCKRSKGRSQEVLSSVFDLFPILFERRTQMAGYLSGGEQQMLAFGRALMSDPKMMLVDEPSMGLSPKMTHTIMDAIQSISEGGIGVLMVEQNVTAALSICKEAVLLERGSVILSGTADEIRNDAAIEGAFLGVAN